MKKKNEKSWVLASFASCKVDKIQIVNMGSK